jgi:spermidine synthase
MVWTLSNRLLFTAIFISGASALVYQLIWVRLLGLVFGVSSFAVATVVAVFLLGLGLGSYFFGRWSERARDPLRIYLYVELGIAATSLCRSTDTSTSMRTTTSASTAFLSRGCCCR